MIGNIADCMAGLPFVVGALGLRKNWGSHIDASHSRQPLVKGERLVRHEVNAVMQGIWMQGNNARLQYNSITNAYGARPCSPLCYPKGYAAPGSVQGQCNM